MHGYSGQQVVAGYLSLPNEVTIEVLPGASDGIVAVVAHTATASWEAHIASTMIVHPNRFPLSWRLLRAEAVKALNL
jgi:hypothetical protein